MIGDVPTWEITPEWVEMHLLEAGRTLMKLRGATGPGGMRSFWPEVVQDYWEVYGQHAEAIQMPRATPAQVTHMDEVLGWLGLVRVVAHRKCVAMKLLNRPDTHRQVWSDRKIGAHLRTSNHTVKCWYQSGLASISQGLVKKRGSQTSHFSGTKAA